MRADKLLTTLRSLLFNEEPQEGCGTGKFLVKDKDYIDLCVEHDRNWNTAKNIREILGYDLRFAFKTRGRALLFLGKALKGFAFGLIVILFSWIIYYIKKK